MICVEGYRAFRGTMRIVSCDVPPYKAKNNSFTLTGDWLYKPQHDRWYGCGQSFGADICEIVEDKT